MSKILKAPSAEDLMRDAVEVSAYYGEWVCPKCKQLCWYNNVPHPKILALQESEDAKLRFRLSELLAMTHCFRQEIQDHLDVHALEETVTNG